MIVALLLFGVASSAFVAGWFACLIFGPESGP